MAKKTEGYIPTFSGKPEELDSFVDMILDDMTIEQLAYYSLVKFAPDSVVTKSGYLLPPNSNGWQNNVCGVDTDLPIPIHIGQSWNKELAKEVGRVAGDEYRGKVASTNPNTLSNAGLCDLRSNPLNGRYYEGFSEDTYMMGVMSSYTTNGHIGDDGFYVKTQIFTKHYSTYQCEWDRTEKTNYINHRTLREYQIPAYLRPVGDNHVIGAMSSFSAINGVPNAYSPYLKELTDAAKYSLYNACDYNGDYETLRNLGNGYDTSYASTGEQVAAYLLLTKSMSSNDDSTLVSADDHIQAVQDGLFGVTEEDLREHIRPQVELWVRSGYFNQDEYPYKSICLDGTPVTSADESSQKVAMQAAEEGYVLLKNEEGLLPLDVNSQVLVTGMFADYRFQPNYTVTTPEGIENAGITPVAALENYLQDKAGGITYAPEMAGDLIRFRSKLNGKYMVANSDDTVTASAETTEDATVFQIYDWGQGGYNFLELESDRWLSADSDYEPTEVVMEARDPAVKSKVMAYQTAEDGSKYLRMGPFTESRVLPREAGIEFYKQYEQLGNYISVDADDNVVIGNPSLSSYTTADLYTEELVAKAGSCVETYAQENDYAVLFVGANTDVNATEFDDRTNMEIGKNQLELVERVSEAFPGRTIVVLKTDLPLSINEIQDNENVAAILYMSYGGEFDALALAKILFGEVTPSGKLTGSWLKDLSTLPKLSVYDPNTGADSRYTVYMKNADMAQLRLTYQYNKKEDVLYDFGYGLSYTDFAYDQFTVTLPSVSDNKVKASVRISNVGAKEGKEVIQMYVSALESEYGTYVPTRKLCAFEKTDTLQAGESQVITLEADLSAMQVWDVATGAYILETGTYKFMIGKSCEDEIYSFATKITGTELGTISLSEAKNVWEICAACEGTRGIEVSKKRTAEYDGGYFAVQSVLAGDYVIIPKVALEDVTGFEITVASINAGSQIEIYTDGIEGQPICRFAFNPTQPDTYYLDKKETISVTELSYTTLQETLSTTLNQTSDLYIVFKQPDIRLDSIRALK